MDKAKMISVHADIAAERALDAYCSKVLAHNESESPVTMNSFVGDVSKQITLDCLGLYNGEEL